MSVINVKIKTDRLILRPLHKDDGDEIVKLLNDYEVSRWLTVVPYPYTYADFEWFLNHLSKTSPLHGLAITQDDKLLGVIGLKPTLGYWLGRQFHGRGIMTEAAKALVGWHFDHHNSDHIRSGYFDGNHASKAVLHKLGFHETGVITQDHCVSQNKDVPLIQVHLDPANWMAAR